MMKFNLEKLNKRLEWLRPNQMDDDDEWLSFRADFVTLMICVLIVVFVFVSVISLRGVWD